MSNEIYKQKLKEAGYKLTPQRLKIITIFNETEGEHLSAEDVYEIVKEEDSEFGLATVYRTIQLLESLGILSSISVGDGKARYELHDEHYGHHHHHMICEECGSIEEFKGDLLDELEREIYNKHKFIIKDHKLKFYGICEKCQAKNKKITSK